MKLKSVYSCDTIPYKYIMDDQTRHKETTFLDSCWLKRGALLRQARSLICHVLRKNRMVVKTSHQPVVVFSTAVVITTTAG